MRLIFIRHAEPNYEEDCLTPKGRREAELLSKRVSAWKNIRDIYVSPMGRAQETASYSLKALKRKAVTCDWLKEFMYRVIDPMTGKERLAWDLMPDYFTNVPEFYDKDHWMDTELYRSNPEFYPAYLHVCDSLDQIIRRYGYTRDHNEYLCDRSVTEDDDNQNTLFFCHFGVTSVMLSHLIGVSPIILLHQFISMPTGVTVVYTEKRDDEHAMFRIQLYGDTRHLTDAGELVSEAGAFSDVFQG